MREPAPGPQVRRVIAIATRAFDKGGDRATIRDRVISAWGISHGLFQLWRASALRAANQDRAIDLIVSRLKATGAETAWDNDRDLAANLEAVVLAKEIGFFRLINATPHGAELLAVDAELTHRHVARLDAAYTSLLTRFAEVAEQAGADLTAFGGADGLAEFVATAGAGLKHEVRTEPAYRDAVRRLARVVAAAAQPLPKEKRP